VSEELLPVINEIKGDLPYLRDIIVISEVEGAHIPFRQKYRSGSASIKTAFTTVKMSDSGFTVRVPQALPREPSILNTIW